MGHHLAVLKLPPKCTPVLKAYLKSYIKDSSPTQDELTEEYYNLLPMSPLLEACSELQNRLVFEDWCQEQGRRGGVARVLWMAAKPPPTVVMLKKTIGIVSRETGEHSYELDDEEWKVAFTLARHALEAHNQAKYVRIVHMVHIPPRPRVDEITIVLGTGRIRYGCCLEQPFVAECGSEVDSNTL